jgi:hypothetical protein
MRLLSIDARTTGRDRTALARLIESADADIACVHHGPHLLRWRSICAALGRRSGLVVVTGGRLAGADLVLSTLGVDVDATQDLSSDAGSVRHPAGAALAALRLRETRFVLVSATLVGDAAARGDQAAAVCAAAGSLVAEDLPAVLCVDGVVAPDTPAWDELAADRVPIGGRVFVDRRLGVAESQELAGATTDGLVPALVVRMLRDI